MNIERAAGTPLCDYGCLPGEPCKVNPCPALAHLRDTAVPTTEYMEAFAAGFNAAQRGVPNEPGPFMEAMNSAFHMSGGELARRICDGTASDDDLARYNKLRATWSI